MKGFAAVILAAGEGTRIKARRKNKVAYKLAGKPMIRYTVETLEKAGIEEIIVVVKFAEKSVREALKGKRIIYARQKDKKGTAPALESGLEAVPGGIQNILVMYGDDSAFYPVELFQFILTEHQKYESDVTLLSIKVDNPKGLGRILRDDNGEALGIVEEKVATDEQKEIKEINTGCYCFRRDFIEKRIGEIEINPVSQEYYLTDIVEVALSHSDRVHVCLYPDNLIWHGINDRSQWAKAIRKKKYGEKKEPQSMLTSARALRARCRRAQLRGSGPPSLTSGLFSTIRTRPEERLVGGLDVPADFSGEKIRARPKRTR